MKRILNFGDFHRLDEAKSLDLESQFLKDLMLATNKRIVNILNSSPLFGGFKIKPYDNRYEIFYTWKGKEKSLGVFYDPSVPVKHSFEAKNRFTLSDETFNRLQIEDPKYSLSSPTGWVCTSYMEREMEKMVNELKEAAKSFDLFGNIDSLGAWKDLEKIGAEIVSTPIERKNGTLAIKFPEYGGVYLIQKSGYLRRRGVDGFLSTKPELIKPITSIEDLVPKLAYIYNVSLKDRFYDLFQEKNVNKKDLLDLIKLFSTEGTSSDLYKEKFNEFTNKYPLMSHLLPAPQNLEDSSLIKASKMLGSFGIF